MSTEKKLLGMWGKRFSWKKHKMHKTLKAFPLQLFAQLKTWQNKQNYATFLHQNVPWTRRRHRREKKIAKKRISSHLEMQCNWEEVKLRQQTKVKMSFREHPSRRLCKCWQLVGQIFEGAEQVSASPTAPALLPLKYTTKEGKIAKRIARKSGESSTAIITVINWNQLMNAKRFTASNESRLWEIWVVSFITHARLHPCNWFAFRTSNCYRFATLRGFLCKQ